MVTGSAPDELLRPFVDLRDVQLRLQFEQKHGLYIAEGAKVIERAIAAGHVPVTFLLTERWLNDLRDLIDGFDVDCIVMTEGDIEQVTGFHVHRGALAAFARPAPADLHTTLAEARRVIVLEDLVDHTNVGAAFRAAAAMGFDAAVLSPRCADPFYRRAIKVAMGAVFSLPHTRVDDWYTLPDDLRELGFTSYAFTLAEDSRPLDEVPVDVERLAVIVGSEGHGLTPRWQAASDVRVRIPMAEGIDSLNVASSVAVAAWHLRRR